ncbi:Solute Carrier Family 35 Member F1 [Manis pentadactyla]|nr:Solute Carrier Family 35 Member F1 [Manis pentadactyla]
MVDYRQGESKIIIILAQRILSPFLKGKLDLKSNYPFMPGTVFVLNAGWISQRIAANVLLLNVTVSALPLQDFSNKRWDNVDIIPRKGEKKSSKNKGAVNE